MSLVADYSDTSSSSSSSDSETESETEQKTDESTKKPLLPSAKSILQTNDAKAGEVFQTKYHKEEQAKKASLERHVKMVENDEHITTKNGRKICWNYRKGRCRFGTKCQYAHDSDLLTENPQQSTKTSTSKQTHTTNISQEAEIQNDEGETSRSVKRKRPGLGDAIIPGKRVLKAYEQQNK